MAALFLYHFFILPYPASDRRAVRTPSTSLSRSSSTRLAFLQEKRHPFRSCFLSLLPPRGDQLIKIIVPFLLDPRPKGGLGLTTSEVGVIYGTVGVVALLLEGFLAICHLQKKDLGSGSGSWSAPSIFLISSMFYLSHAMPYNF